MITEFKTVHDHSDRTPSSRLKRRRSQLSSDSEICRQDFAAPRTIVQSSGEPNKDYTLAEPLTFAIRAIFKNRSSARKTPSNSLSTRSGRIPGVLALGEFWIYGWIRTRLLQYTLGRCTLGWREPRIAMALPLLFSVHGKWVGLTGCTSSGLKDGWMHPCLFCSLDALGGDVAFRIAFVAREFTSGEPPPLLGCWIAGWDFGGCFCDDPIVTTTGHFIRCNFDQSTSLDWKEVSGREYFDVYDG